MYTDCTIGGVNVYVDPDVSFDLTPMGTVKPAIDGTMFVNTLYTNPANSGFIMRISFNGAFLREDDVAEIREKVKARELVRLVGVPSVSNLSRFFIQSMIDQPLKPGVRFPEETFSNLVIKHSYRLSLIQVTKF